MVLIKKRVYGDCCCQDEEHKVHLENYYCDIMNAVVKAESFLPKSSPTFQRSFGSAELDELKKNSIECCNYWKSMGSETWTVLGDYSGFF